MAAGVAIENATNTTKMGLFCHRKGDYEDRVIEVLAAIKLGFGDNESAGFVTGREINNSFLQLIGFSGL